MNDRMQENDRTAQDPFQSWSLTFMLFAVLFATLGSLALYVISSPELRKLSRFGRALNTTLSRYSGELNGQDFYENGAVELYRLLDRYSGYAPKERYEQIYEEFSGSYAGLGVTIIARPQGLLVASVNEAGPSRPAGLLLGDIIISADSVSLVGLNTRDASLILRGEPGAELEIKALRPSGS
ncbi:MAG: S41 family peptidase, partial [Candidatus Zixiibacteriota bacterium]